jgi:serine/threonine protein kinase/formylglycine-generating enzyme required for sulfatase activity
MGDIPIADWSSIHATAERFQSAWKGGLRPRIEDYLAETDEASRGGLLEELLRVEGELRRRDGDPSPLEEYLRRFPRYRDVVAAVVDGGPVGSKPCAEAGRSPSLTVASAFDRDSPQSLPPSLASRPDYRIVRELGRGGMGVVYLAHNRLMARDEVLKVMGRHIVERPGVLDRFLREIRAVARLRHPNIVSAYTAFHSGDELVFAMEYVVGLNLSQVVKAKGAIAVRQACVYAHQAALGLQYAHEEGMVHRDIKPANLMLSYQKDRPLIKLLDFGLSKAASEQSASGMGIEMAIESYDFGEHLTCTGEMLGTPGFIAPEQITDSQQADIRADIYSLGCTLYYLLSGEAPFSNLSLLGVLRAHRTRHARPLDQVRSEVPADLAAIVARMMAKEPADRFQEPGEVAEALKPFFKKGLAMAAESSPEVPTVAGNPADATPPGPILEGLIDLSEPDAEPGGLRDGRSPKVSPELGRRSQSGVELLERLRLSGVWGRSAIVGMMILGVLTTWAVVGTNVRRDVTPPSIADRKPTSEHEEAGPAPSKLPPTPPAPRKARHDDRALTADEVAASHSAGADRSTFNPGPPATPPASPEIPHPFRMATHGLGSMEFIDSISLKPDWSGFDEPGTALAWATRDDFARLATRAAIAYPRLSESRYVLELDLTVNAYGRVVIRTGDPTNRCEIAFAWNDERRMIECTLYHCIYNVCWFSGPQTHHDLAPGKRTRIRLVVGDGAQVLFHEEARILQAGCWPTDCCVGITSHKADSAVIHRCSLRPLTPGDVAACGWPTPPTDLNLDARASRARLGSLFGMLPTRPRREHPFLVKTTETPMVWIKPGAFVMGPRDPKDNGRHRVRLTKGYWMAQTEVTQWAFRRVTDGNPSRIAGSPYLPVDGVAWDQAMAFCRKLTEVERKVGRLPTGYEYRLPTEAEWEYACRAGSDEDFSVPTPMIWSRDRGECRPHEVADSQPNLWGLYDMPGNAMEWCLDAWYEYPTGSKEVSVDPVKIGKPDKDTAFVVRGGAWWAGDGICTSGWRERNANTPNGYLGFRIVLGPEIRDIKIKE